jgi:thiol-disulfide isomerase/thioredoxin
VSGVRVGRVAGIVALAASMVLLAGCTTGSLDDQVANGSDDGYISGDGSTVELTPEQRTDPVEFEGVDENGGAISSADFLGSVYVVNFWWAGCAPCRVEAPDLAALSEEYDEVPFLGVNTQDGPDNARSFSEEYGIEYPSILDVDDVSVQLAFAGSGMPPNAVPTTLVMDREGRVAGRVSGLISDPSILSAMIDRVLEEQ